MLVWAVNSQVRTVHLSLFLRHRSFYLNTSISFRIRISKESAKYRQACCDASMAQPNPEITLQVDATGKDVNKEEKEECTESAGLKSAGDSTIVDSVETNVRQDTTADAQSTAPPARPSLVPLGSSHGQSSSLSTPTAPKRFSAVNINKKFLEKNTVTGSSTISSSTSSNMKVGNSACK